MVAISPAPDMLPILLRSLLVYLLAIACLPAQTPPEPPTPPAPRVEVPIWPNATCPIMGKKVSLPLFVDSELGRFYVCCKPCFKKILANVDAAYRTAFPVVQELQNSTCPVTGKPIGEQPITMQLQGYSFRICSEACRITAIADAQVVLARLLHANLREVGNRTCPVTGLPVQPNHFVLVDDHLIRLADASQVAAVEKAPALMLAKAQELAKAQQEPPPPAPKPTPAGGGK